MILEKSVYNCKGGFISAMFCLHTFFGSDHYSLQFSDFSGAVSVGSESADQAPIKRLKVFQWRGLCQRNCEQDVQVRKWRFWVVSDVHGGAAVECVSWVKRKTEQCLFMGGEQGWGDCLWNQSTCRGLLAASLQLVLPPCRDWTTHPQHGWYVSLVRVCWLNHLSYWSIHCLCIQF